MSDVQTVRGFEEVWRPTQRPRRRTPQNIPASLPTSSGVDGLARLARIADRAPEVVVRITGRALDVRGLRARLDYISRNGRLEMEDRDGAVIVGRGDLKELAEDWSEAALADPRRRITTPISRSIVLSMPAGTDPMALRDAARAFARDRFADRFDYVSALHTDADHPHVHMAIRALGDHGERLNPKTGDLMTWRQVFAEALRERGVEAEATPRWARGVTRKAERGPLRRIRERYEAGQGEAAWVWRAAYQEAARAAFGGDKAPTPWEIRMMERQSQIRGLYLAQAQALLRSTDAADQALGAKVETFVRGMPPPDSQRLALARALRAANAALSREQERAGSTGPERQR